MVKVDVCSRSRHEVERDCKAWAKEIKRSYSPDLIVFIAKSGYLFANEMRGVFDCDMESIYASRPASGNKDKLKGIINKVPEKIVLKIISSPLMYKFNERNKERNVEFSKGLIAARKKGYTSILLVDDSVDTGITLGKVEKKLKKAFPKAEIKSAAYAVIDYSSGRATVDYYRHKNKIILTATSRRSSEYEKFLADFNSWELNH